MLRAAGIVANHAVNRQNFFAVVSPIDCTADDFCGRGQAAGKPPLPPQLDSGSVIDHVGLCRFVELWPDNTRLYLAITMTLTIVMAVYGLDLFSHNSELKAVPAKYNA